MNIGCSFKLDYRNPKKKKFVPAKICQIFYRSHTFVTFPCQNAQTIPV